MSDIDVEVEADAWLEALPDCEQVARAAAEAALSPRVRGETGGGTPPEGGTTTRPLRPSGPPPPQAGEESVAILLTDDAEVRRLNREHRRQDKPTNVLSFPAAETAIGHLGDVALAFETCAREAAEQGKPLGHHLAHLVVHGVLHLTGWDHQLEADGDAMEERERQALAGLGVPDPYSVKHP